MLESKFDLFIVTDSYAGNFERELCAYVTGHIGECEVGDDLVEDKIHDLFSSYIDSHHSNDGCYRPVEIAEYQEEYNALTIGLHKSITDSYLLDIIAERLEEFAKMENIKIKFFNIRAVHILTSYEEIYTYLSNIK